MREPNDQESITCQTVLQDETEPLNVPITLKENKPAKNFPIKQTLGTHGFTGEFD